MNYNINDEVFKKSEIYQSFLKSNPGSGNLRIRAYAANGAVPISNLKVVVSKNINNYNVVFFEGLTDESGLIERISLPAPIIESDNLISPNYITYDIIATYNNIDLLYKINMYDDVCVIQNISVVPDMGMGEI